MSKESNRTQWKVIAFVLSFSFIGAIICRIIEIIVSKSYLSKVTMVFVVIWCVTLAVFVPIQIMVFDRKERKGQTLEKLTIKNLIGLPFGTANPNAKISKWITIPVLSLLFLLLSIFVIFVAMILVTYFTSIVVGK
jgi:hypothetical protein